MTSHLVLLGDSIFDNHVYVAPEPAVVDQVRGELGTSWQVTLAAVDGDTTTGVNRQLCHVPIDATHLAVSAGGNDALHSAHLLEARVNTIGEAILRLATAKDRFRSNYENMVDTVLERRLPTALCTIYDANYPEPHGTVISAALSLFNDVITRVAFGRGTALIDLRLICDQSADYANPIEPSSAGGGKIARALASFARAQTACSRSTVFLS
jgi:hypothetical protein